MGRCMAAGSDRGSSYPETKVPLPLALGIYGSGTATKEGGGFGKWAFMSPPPPPLAQSNFLPALLVWA